MKKIIMIIALMLCQITVKASSEEIVDTAFPTKTTHYSQKEFLAGFKPIVLEPLWNDFKEGWTIIYEGLDKGAAKRLPVEDETSHIRCFYRTLSGLKGTGNDLLETQLLTINGYFSASTTHMKLIGARNSELAERILD